MKSPQETGGWESQVRGSIGTAVLNSNNLDEIKKVEEALLVFLREKIAEAEKRGYERGVVACIKHNKEVNDMFIKESRAQALREIEEIIETKLKNDPNNPVLVAGLKYVLVTLSKL